MALPVIFVIFSLGLPVQGSGDAPEPTKVRTPQVGFQEHVVDPDLVFLRAVLFDAAGSAEVRRAAASRIAYRGSPDSSQILREALGSGNELLMAAVVDAIGSTGTPPREVVEAMVESLTLASPQLRQRMAAILSETGAVATESLMAVVGRHGAGVPARIAAIEAIGALRGDAGIDQFLIELLQEKDGAAEPPEVQRAAINSLARLTGLDLGSDASAWIAWWQGTGSGESPESALSRVRLRLIEVERSLAAANQRAVLLAERVEEFANRLALALTREERFALAARLLSDSVPQVRRAGIAQFERALRNGERPDESSQQLLAQVMQDQDTSVRISAARLLVALGTPGLAARLAEALSHEKDAQVSGELLDLVSVAPSADAFAPAVEWLATSGTSESAATALWSIIRGGMAPRGWQLTLADLVHAAAAKSASPAVLRLEAALSKGDEVSPAVLHYLDDRDAAVRRGVAEGLRQAGLWQVLLVRAQSDEAVYDAAVGAIADSDRSLSALERLISLAPRVTQESSWNKALGGLLRGLSPADLLTADARLETVGWTDQHIRAEALRGALESLSMGPSIGDLKREQELTDMLASRGATALMRAEEYQGALQLLESRSPAPGTPLRALAFLAAIHAGDFTAAFRANEDPRAWLQALSSLAPSDPTRALPLADEIRLRFSGKLAEDDQSLLEALTGSLIGRTPAGG